MLRRSGKRISHGDQTAGEVHVEVIGIGIPDNGFDVVTLEDPDVLATLLDFS